jgi:hypothetical protein
MYMYCTRSVLEVYTERFQQHIHGFDFPGIQKTMLLPNPGILSSSSVDDGEYIRNPIVHARAWTGLQEVNVAPWHSINVRSGAKTIPASLQNLVNRSLASGLTARSILAVVDQFVTTKTTTIRQCFAAETRNLKNSPQA